MSIHGIKTEHHLTPRGWVVGAQAIFGPFRDAARQRPEDALATYEEHIRLDPDSMREKIVWRESWRREGTTESVLDGLLDQHGRRMDEVKG